MGASPFSSAILCRVYFSIKRGAKSTSYNVPSAYDLDICCRRCVVDFVVYVFLGRPSRRNRCSFVGSKWKSCRLQNSRCIAYWVDGIALAECVLVFLLQSRHCQWLARTSLHKLDTGTSFGLAIRHRLKHSYSVLSIHISICIRLQFSPFPVGTQGCIVLHALGSSSMRCFGGGHNFDDVGMLAVFPTDASGRQVEVFGSSPRNSGGSKG